jgi:hypothetical protein
MITPTLRADATQVAPVLIENEGAGEVKKEK